ncbi:hypothetical protein KQX54_011916 [Cotesia glomerata]|uniref:Uncharacterized protein n=1 Tax=Cotesia glomerata TaxID=32391 RepID=A0AAV7ILR0_COTGL|nr:hypothetical protein KQX54_011916 [Cotesia glomerata]
MKCHLIVGVLVVLTLFLDGTFAGRGRGSFNFRRGKPTSRNNQGNHRSPSPEVRRFSPQNSQFRPVSPEALSRPARAPTPPPSSSPSRFGRLQLSPASRSPLPSVSQSGNSENPISPEISKPTIQEQDSKIHKIANKYSDERLNVVNQHFIRPKAVIPDRSKPPPTLEELKKNPKHPQFKPRNIIPPPLVNNPQANPPPLPSYQFPSLYPVRPPRTRTTKPPAKVANSVPGPSESRPTSITALVQAGAAPAPGSRAAQKAAKTSNMKPGISKSETKEQATPQQINANIGTCKDKNASADKCFDILILALSWGPATKALRYAIESPINRAEWSIHGFWPSSKNNGRVPFSCDLKKKFYDHEQILPIKDLLKENWLSLNGFSRSNREFWEHEWIKHGTCASRLPAMKNVRLYFEKTLEIFYKANVYAKLTAGGFRPRTVMTQKDMRDKISMILKQRVNIAIQYHPRTSEMWLSEIRLCYDLHFNAVDCPPNRASQMADKENLMIIYSL